MSTDQTVGGDGYTYYYDARKRLVQVLKNGVSAGTYGYDYLGHRVWRSVAGGASVHYIFDEGGHLLSEQDANTGAVLKEYIWIDDLPVAVVDSSSGAPVTYYLSTGHLNEPLQLLDGSGAKVWDAYMNPWGWTGTLAPPSAAIDLRLPGQWATLEANGLSQNWNRDYDPSIGRYVQADPLGIDAGQNVYGYVDGDPLDLTDPLGLIWTYDQQSGQLSHNGVPVDTGYSGNQAGLNNPSAQNQANHGPIPQGDWNIGPQQTNTTGAGGRLPGSMRLSPMPGTTTFGRAGFLIHGDNKRHNHSASEGCIILNRHTRDLIIRSGDRLLRVIP